MALQTLFEAQALEPNRVVTQALMVDAYRKQGNFKEAQRFHRMAMKLHPKESRLLRAAGELELAQEHPREALDDFTQAGADGNATPELHRLIGETLMGLGRYGLAEEEFRLSADQPGVPARLARLLEKRREFAEAADYAVRALE
jgi:Tfp pilus assembly protein PilF